MVNHEFDRMNRAFSGKPLILLPSNRNSVITNA